MLSNAGLGRRFWTKFVSTSGDLINHGPQEDINCKAPYEVWYDKYAHYSL